MQEIKLFTPKDINEPEFSETIRSVAELYSEIFAEEEWEDDIKSESVIQAIKKQVVGWARLAVAFHHDQVIGFCWGQLPRATPLMII